ncbi:ankyrin repeat domain-containing protein [Actinoplanes sp. HUAS TT8]|uniref:ankyrin repeat domain-containing protein n=1 Tax=Actinoplanes sp. HUAS TT8 TaxID=3447453 RepID=UPI003F51FFA7
MDLERRRSRDRYARTMDHASPAGMIVRATAARRAGDWRAACVAAAVDVHIGAEQATTVESDLAGFAPDFLRRHLPRDDNQRLHPGVRVVLSRSAEPFRTSTPVLVVTLPVGEDAAQRLDLRVAAAGDLDGTWLDLPPWAWHADAVQERRLAYGASAARLPWHFADGTPYAQGLVDSVDEDRAAEFERLLAPVGRDRITDLYRSAGLEVERRGQREWFTLALIRMQDRLPLLAAEARRLAHRYGPEARIFPALNWGGLDLRTEGDSLRTKGDGLRLGDDALRSGHAGAVVSWEWPRSWDQKGPAGFGIAAPRDAALLRWGVLTPDQLHPLVHEALFPDRVQDWQPLPHDPYGAYRVRCGADWHVVEGIGASVSTPYHGEAAGGCAAAAEAFLTGIGRVPKEIRRHRQDLFGRAFHGDTDGLLADLEAGFDPRLRDRRGRSLLHWVGHVDHRRVLPVLLAGGLPLDEQDRDGQTPLHVAAQSGAEDTMAALIAAGARASIQDAQGQTAREVLATTRKRKRS